MVCVKGDGGACETEAPSNHDTDALLPTTHFISKETSKFQKLRILPPAATSPSSPGSHCQAPKGCSLLGVSR